MARSIAGHRLRPNASGMRNAGRTLQHHNTRSARRRLRQLAGKTSPVSAAHQPQHRQTHRADGATLRCRDCPGRPPGIRQRVKARRSQRARHANWGFFQLRQCVTYKAAMAGIPVMLVDPKHTSQECHACVTISPELTVQPKTEFSCHRCGYTTARISSPRGTSEARAVVNRRMVAQPRQLRLALA